MKGTRVAIVKSKSPIQQKVYEIRKLESGEYELNMICPCSYNFGVFKTPGDCKKKALKMNVLGIEVTKL